MTTEEIYDNEIAPKLLEVAEFCKTLKISFLAVVEWSPGKIGITDVQTPEECLSMMMVHHCVKTVPNIDGYCIGLNRYAKENDIDVSNSIIMSLLRRRTICKG